MAEARTKKLTNPFYVALLFVGAIFGVTACAYVVMMLVMASPKPIDETALSSFIKIMNRYGTIILIVELAMLGVLTLGAIATDDFWTGEGKREQPPESPEENSTVREK